MKLLALLFLAVVATALPTNFIGMSILQLFFQSDQSALNMSIESTADVVPRNEDYVHHEVQVFDQELTTCGSVSNVC